MTLLLQPTSVAVDAAAQHEALAARVFDPLWFLARQWQTGAFIASDGGSAVDVFLDYTLARLDHAGQPVQEALEPVIEAEPLPTLDAVDTGSRMQLAAELVRRLRDSRLTSEQVTTVRAALAEEFPLEPSDPQSALAALVRRLPDPAKLHDRLTGLGPEGTGGPFPDLPGVRALDPMAGARAQDAVRNWYAWMTAQINAATSEPHRNAPPSWNPERLEYEFTLTATDSGGDGEPSLTAGGSMMLRAIGYDGLGLDWYSFDRDPYSSLTPPPLQPRLTVRPSPVTYPGMPRPRFWELEDGDVNLDALRASDNPAHAALAVFAHQYSNDWFLVPLVVPSGVCRVIQLTVIDTFGTTTTVAAAAVLDSGKSPWGMWDLSRTETPEYGAQGTDPVPESRLFLPSVSPALEGSLIEDVLVARDEMANLAWVIELTTRDRDGTPVDRQQRWSRLRPELDSSFDPATPRTYDYRLGTTVPDYWYPLASVIDGGKPLLALAELPPQASGVGEDDVRGQLIHHNDKTRIADEEVPREGTRLTRRDRLTWRRSGPLVWRARTKAPGRGGTSSGLRFDILE